MATHFCVRVYLNGEARYTLRDDKGLESWLSHNRKFRWGNALFVDGRLADSATDRGYLNDDQIAHVTEVLRDAFANMRAAAPWQPAYDRAEKATIYPEAAWRQFEWPNPSPAAAASASA